MDREVELIEETVIAAGGLLGAIVEDIVIIVYQNIHFLSPS